MMRLYLQDLLAHYGCVNAVEFSDDGDLMVTGGDDRRVLLWNVDRATMSDGRYQPTRMTGEHESNIFCLHMDREKTKVFSGGNDASVIVHDLVTTKPLEFYRHEEPVYGLSVNPLNSNIFLTACSDGRVLLYDLRQKPGEEPLLLAGYSHAFHAAQFNPCEPRLVVTSNQKMGLGLWDVRRPGTLVLGYGGAGGVTETSMYVRWNMRGDRILGLRRRLSPVLYRVDSPAAVAQFDHPGYYNSCTMKSCCFGGPDDEFVLSGSDDFNLYMWRVPAEGETSPQWVARAHHVLQGHRSIVNQVRYNRSRSLVASSGVEKVVKVWSVLALPDNTSHHLNIEKERRVYSHEEYIGLVLREGSMISHDYSSESTNENPRMMAFFDSLVQREIEGWNTSDGDESDSESEEYSNTVEEGEDSDTVPYTRRERSGGESGIPQSSPTNTTTGSSSVLNSSSDSGLETGQANADRARSPPSERLESPNIERIISEPPAPQVEAETQTPPQSSQNLISDLIAKKRIQLMRRSRKKEESVRSDPSEESKLLQARRTLRSDSNTSSVSASSQEESRPGPSGSSVLSRLKRKRARLAANKSHTDSEPEDTENTERVSEEDGSGGTILFKKMSKNKQRNIRKKSSDESD